MPEICDNCHRPTTGRGCCTADWLHLGNIGPDGERHIDEAYTARAKADCAAARDRLLATQERWIARKHDGLDVVEHRYTAPTFTLLVDETFMQPFPFTVLLFARHGDSPWRLLDARGTTLEEVKASALAEAQRWMATQKALSEKETL